MKKKTNSTDREQVMGYEGPGKAVNFFDPVPDEETEKLTNSDVVNSLPDNKKE
ncbi:hypothetical protein [Rossellomorea aquimaris]|uniref:hypothetical protein n=1 Tax=Rossellomorea aquimaris TaxID=189382 RepID=UPI000A3E0ED3|nr:hypothetical protein [Rossellomorea aquimaris]